MLWEGHSLYLFSSASSSSMAAKSALPTPTIMIDMGSREARMMLFLASTMSEMAPSVNIRSIKYCWEGEKKYYLEGERLKAVLVSVS